MKSLLILASTILFSVHAGATADSMIFKSVSCTIENEKGDIWFTAQPFIPVATEAGAASFIQLRHVTTEEEIQYQLLIEPTEAPQTFVVLQNFKINQEEISVETRTEKVETVEIKQGAWSARCDVVKK